MELKENLKVEEELKHNVIEEKNSEISKLTSLQINYEREKEGLNKIIENLKNEIEVNKKQIEEKEKEMINLNETVNKQSLQFQKD